MNKKVLIALSIFFFLHMAKAGVTQEQKRDVSRLETHCKYSTIAYYREGKMKANNPKVVRDIEKYAKIRQRIGVKASTKILEECDALVKKFKEDGQSLPSAQAEMKIGDALGHCATVDKYIGTGVLGVDGIRQEWEYYINNKKKAYQIDARSKNTKKEKVAYCDTVVADKIDKMEQSIAEEKLRRHREIERQKQERKKRQEKEMAEQKQREAERRRLFQAKEKQAQKKGYKGLAIGMRRFLESLQYKNLGFNDIKNFLVEVSNEDVFEVQNVMDKYVIYVGGNPLDNNFLQFAVIKEKGKIYTEKKWLRLGFYKLISVQEFKTVMGQAKQIVVFKSVENL